MKWTLFFDIGPPPVGEPEDTASAGLDGRTWYQVLGVDPQVEHFVIETVYRAQMRRHHPDRGGDTARAQLFNEAYRVLRDPEARARYDEELARGPVAPKPGEAVAASTARVGRATSGPSIAYLVLGVLLVISGAVTLRTPIESAARSVFLAITHRTGPAAIVRGRTA